MDSGLQLNIGCHTSFFMFPKPWINIDKNDLSPIMQRNCEFLLHDVLNGIPYPDNTVSLIYHSDIFEHFSYHEATWFLKECHRVLKKGGLMRVCVPDLNYLLQHYSSQQMQHFDEIQPPEFRQVKAQSLKLSMILFGSLGSTQTDYKGHQMGYDSEGLKEMLEMHGFIDVKTMDIDRSQSPLMCNKDVHRDSELIMECRTCG